MYIPSIQDLQDEKKEKVLQTKGKSRRKSKKNGKRWKMKSFSYQNNKKG